MEREWEGKGRKGYTEWNRECGELVITEDILRKVMMRGSLRGDWMKN